MSGHISQLPDEILKNIFDRVAPNEIEKIKKLNKRFNAIGNRFKLGQVEVHSVKFQLGCKRRADDIPLNHIKSVANFPKETDGNKEWKFDVLIDPSEPKMALLDSVHKCFHKISAFKMLELEGANVVDMELLEVLEGTGVNISDVNSFVLKKSVVRLTREQLKTFVKKMPLKTLVFENIKTDNNLLDNELALIPTEMFIFKPASEMNCPDLNVEFLEKQMKRTTPLKEFSCEYCKPGFYLSDLMLMSTHLRAAQKAATWNIDMHPYNEKNDKVLLQFNRARTPLTVNDEGAIGRKYEFTIANRNNLRNRIDSNLTLVMFHGHKANNYAQRVSNFKLAPWIRRIRNVILILNKNKNKNKKNE